MAEHPPGSVEWYRQIALPLSYKERKRKATKRAKAARKARNPKPVTASIGKAPKRRRKRKTKSVKTIPKRKYRCNHCGNEQFHYKHELLKAPKAKCTKCGGTLVNVNPYFPKYGPPTVGQQTVQLCGTNGRMLSRQSDICGPNLKDVTDSNNQRPPSLEARGVGQDEDAGHLTS